RVGSIRGSITLPDGSPAANATVYSFFPGNLVRIGQSHTNSLRDIHTDSEGLFSHNSFPVGIPFGLYVETSDGKAAGILTPAEHPSDKPLHLQLQPTERCAIIPRGDNKEILPNSSLT